MSAVLTILGVVVGAILTYFFTQSQEQKKHYRLLQTTAYADYLRGVADAAHIALVTKRPEIDAKVSDAEARICLYGSPQVIRLLAEFKRKGNAIITDEQCDAFTRLIQAMRGDDNVDGDVLQTVLVGPNRTVAR